MEPAAASGGGSRGRDGHTHAQHFHTRFFSILVSRFAIPAILNHQQEQTSAATGNDGGGWWLW